MRRPEEHTIFFPVGRLVGLGCCTVKIRTWCIVHIDESDDEKDDDEHEFFFNKMKHFLKDYEELKRNYSMKIKHNLYLLFGLVKIREG
jgi:hypothetical protein